MDKELHMDLEKIVCLHSPDSAPLMPRKLYIEPTSLCNLNCSMCFRNGWLEAEKGHMDMSLYMKLAREIGEITSLEEVFFGGMGEPLLHPHIGEMLRALPAGVRRSLLTNGTLLDMQTTRMLLEAGLDTLWISMDGFERSAYAAIQRGGRFDTVVQNLTGFDAARKGTSTKLCITFVVTPENMEQLGKINAFADSVHADGINISHMIPGEPLPREGSPFDRSDIPVGPMHRYGESAEPPQEHVCPFVQNGQFFVRWDGEVIPCMQLLHSSYTYLFEQRRKVLSFSYGNIAEKTLLECWQDPKYVAFRQRVASFYFPFCIVCWGCDRREENLSDCYLDEAPTCGACLWSTGKIRCP